MTSRCICNYFPLEWYRGKKQSHRHMSVEDLLRWARSTRYKIVLPPQFVNVLIIIYCPGIFDGHHDKISYLRRYIVRAKAWIEWTLEKLYVMLTIVCCLPEWLGLQLTKSLLSTPTLVPYCICFLFSNSYKLVYKSYAGLRKRLWLIFYILSARFIWLTRIVLFTLSNSTI